MLNDNNISKLNISSSRINKIETPKTNKLSNNNISKIIDDKSNNISFSYSHILPYSFRKSNKINNNNEKKEVLLTSIFTLPKINSSDSLNENMYSPKKKNLINYKKNSMFISYENSNKVNNNNNSILNEYTSIQTEPKISFHKIKNNDQQSLSIINSLKNKFYSDIDQQIKNHKQILAKDKELNQKLIYIKKISTFWNSLCNYMNPIFNIEKFQLKKNIEHNNQIYIKDKSISQNIDNFALNKNANRRKLPRIYTNSMISNLRNNKKKLEERKFNEKLLKKEFDFY